MADPRVTDMHHGLLGTRYQRPATPAFEGPQVITVLPGGTPDGVKFTVDAFGDDWSFGPSPYPRHAPGAVPPAGTKGVALFQPRTDDAHIVALFGWP